MMSDETNEAPSTPFRPPAPGVRSEPPPGPDEERPLPPGDGAPAQTGVTAIPSPVNPL